MNLSVTHGHIFHCTLLLCFDWQFCDGDFFIFIHYFCFVDFYSFFVCDRQLKVITLIGYFKLEVMEFSFLALENFCLLAAYGMSFSLSFAFLFFHRHGNDQRILLHFFDNDNQISSCNFQSIFSEI